VRFDVECLPTGPAPQMITLGVTSMVIVMVLRKEVLRWIIYAPHLGQICGAPHFCVGSLIADLRKVPNNNLTKVGMMAKEKYSMHCPHSKPLIEIGKKGFIAH
jgi:hypothetical protein